MVSRHGLHAQDASSAHKPDEPVTTPRLSTIDLNLLLVFDGIYAERSATRAGHRLGLSQSAVSHALGRLRERLGDELLVKGSDGMVPTVRARGIAPKVRAALADLQSALAPQSFVPETSDQCFAISADPYARAVIVPGLIAALRRLAPGLELRIRPGFTGLTEALDSGEIDIALASYRRVPDRFGLTDVLSERHVWALRADHPQASGALTLERLADLPHLVRIVPGDEDSGADLPSAGRGLERRAIQDDDGALAHALAGIGRTRSVHHTIADSYAALAIVGASDLAALVPERLARALAGHFGLRLFDPPYPSPTLQLSMVWERGRGDSPAVTWLRNLIVQTAHSLG